MGKENQTHVTEFILVGLSSNHQTQILLFVVFLIIYLLTHHFPESVAAGS